MRRAVVALYAPGVVPPVVTSSPSVTSSAGTCIETPLLVGAAGAVVTLLNWGGVPVATPFLVNVSAGFTPSSVASAALGKTLTFTATAAHGVVAVEVPALASADFLSLYR